MLSKVEGGEEIIAEVLGRIDDMGVLLRLLVVELVEWVDLFGVVSWFVVVVAVSE